MTPTVTRYHALDSLRACMMLLGIVVHAAMNYVVTPLDIYLLRDTVTSYWMDGIVFVIHIFRMPLFFVMAGFFAALLYFRRGHKAMLENRFRRIGIPFIVFWPPLYFVLGTLMFGGFNLMATGQFGFDRSVLPENPNGSPWTTFHLWFLYYLLQFYIISIPLGWLLGRLPEGSLSFLPNAFAKLAGSWWGLLVLALAPAAVSYPYPHGLVDITGSFVPEMSQLIYHGVFFISGWLLYQRQDLLQHWAGHAHGFSIAALVATALALYLIIFAEATHDMATAMKTAKALMANIASWLWIVGLTGIFLRYFNSHNPTMRYLTDGSYWIYLIHIVFTMSIAIILFNENLSAITKFIINVIVSSALCLLTWHYLVRNRFIHHLLNGKPKS